MLTSYEKWRLFSYAFSNGLVNGEYRIVIINRELPTVTSLSFFQKRVHLIRFLHIFMFLDLKVFVFVWGFVDHCLSFCPFSFIHCIVDPTSIYGFWLSFWYLKTSLITSILKCELLFLCLFVDNIFLPNKTLSKIEISPWHMQGIRFYSPNTTFRCFRNLTQHGMYM